MGITLVKMRGTVTISEFQPHGRVFMNTDFLYMDMTLVGSSNNSEINWQSTSTRTKKPATVEEHRTRP